MNHEHPSLLLRIETPEIAAGPHHDLVRPTRRLTPESRAAVDAFDDLVLAAQRGDQVAARSLYAELQALGWTAVWIGTRPRRQEGGCS